MPGRWLGRLRQGRHRPWLEHVPFADHNAILDPTCSDLTGRVLELLGAIGFDRQSIAVRRAVAMIRRTQEADGSWYGRWGVNYIYGTWQILRGLAAIGENMEQEWIRRGCDWLESCQNDDGGWGETLRDPTTSLRSKVAVPALPARPPGPLWASAPAATRTATPFSAVSNISVAPKTKTVPGPKTTPPAPDSLRFLPQIRYVSPALPAACAGDLSQANFASVSANVAAMSSSPVMRAPSPHPWLPSLHPGFPLLLNGNHLRLASVSSECSRNPKALGPTRVEGRPGGISARRRASKKPRPCNVDAIRGSCCQRPDC